MSLLSTDITKVKRLSLREVKLPAPELRVEPLTPILVERPPTNEEIAYSKLVIINPLIEDLVECFNLISFTTGDRIKKIDLPKIERPQEVDKAKLITLAQKVIEGESNYSKEDIIDRIKEVNNISKDRAETGFNLMLQAGAISYTIGESYFLTGSTPF